MKETNPPNSNMPYIDIMLTFDYPIEFSNIQTENIYSMNVEYIEYNGNEYEELEAVYSDGDYVDELCESE